MDDISDVEIIAPNFKHRLSGVTSTIIQLIPVQRALGQKVAVLGPGLPASLPHIGYTALAALWRRPKNRALRVWHARRNIEMLPAIVLRDLLRMKLKIVFTSASQRKHSGWTKFLVRKMDAVIATSNRTAAYLEVASTTIMHGIDTQRFFPAEDKANAKTALGLPADKKDRRLLWPRAPPEGHRPLRRQHDCPFAAAAGLDRHHRRPRHAVASGLRDRTEGKSEIGRPCRTHPVCRRTYEYSRLVPGPRPFRRAAALGRFRPHPAGGDGNAGTGRGDRCRRLFRTARHRCGRDRHSHCGRVSCRDDGGFGSVHGRSGTDAARRRARAFACH